LKRIGFDAVYLRHPAWYVRRGLREPSEEMLGEYGVIKKSLNITK